MASLSLWLLTGWEDVLRMVAGQPGVRSQLSRRREVPAHAACTVSLQEGIENLLKSNKS